MKKFKSLSLPAVLAINKIDLLEDKSVLIRQITKFMEQFDFDAVVPVSAQTGDGVGGLVDELKKQAMPALTFLTTTL